jgi:hypothetical protein
MTKIVTENYKYITNSKNDTLNVKSKNTTTDDQNVTISDNGELIINNRCITLGDNNVLHLDKCINSQEQMWEMDYNSILSQKNKQCISHDDNSLFTNECDSSEKQSFSIERSSTPEPGQNIYIGKRLKLVEATEPWHLNKDFTFIEPSAIENPPNNKKMYDYGRLKNCVVDTFIEGFGCVKKRKITLFNATLLILLMIVITLLIYFILSTNKIIKQ